MKRVNMLSINISSPTDIMTKLKERFKEKRLLLDLTQEGLASRSGVSLGSIKRFERSGKVSLDSLLQLALVLECLEDFNQIAKKETHQYNSLDDLLKEKPTKKRGTKK